MRRRDLLLRLGVKLDAKGLDVKEEGAEGK
jgi:hypothetical protein